MKFWLPVLVAFVALGGGAYWYFFGDTGKGKESAIESVRFGEVTRGPISVTVAATGQLQPVTQVDVGTQVSGPLQEILVDFNSPVKAGQVLARLNTDNLVARVAMNRANLKRAESSRERYTVELKNAERQAQRLRDLYEKQIVSLVDVENAEITRDSLTMQVKVSASEIEQARTTLQQSDIDLEHATITSPIDGIVIQRAVEVGQTVAASFNSPLLFQIANDLGRMQIKANIDEADIGRIKRSLRASFTVDALPGRSFEASLSQVRLNPTITNNVVIYTCIFSVENFEKDGSLGPLLPGLTANLTILIEERQDAMLVPAAAPRFQPKGMGVPVPPASGKGVSSAPSSPDVALYAGNGDRSREGKERKEGKNGDSPGSRPMRVSLGSGTLGTIWVKDGNSLRAVNVELGITDGTVIEIVRGELQLSDAVAIGQAQSDVAPQGSFSPFGGNTGGRPGGGMQGGNRTRGGSGR